MSEQNEFSAVPIREDQLVAWPRVAAVSAMVGFSILTFMTGLEVFKGLSPAHALWALFWGSLIVTVIGALLGYIGAKAHMSSYLLVRVAFGDVGAGIVNIALAIALMGWFGLNINLFTGAMDRLLGEVLNLHLPEILLAVIASACMTLTSIIGFKAINRVSVLLIPVMIIVTVLFAKSAFNDMSWANFMVLGKPAGAVGENTMTIGSGISWVVGAVIIGSIILPDITRFMRKPSGAVHTAIWTYLIVGIIVMSSAGLAGVAAGSYESFYGEDYVDRAGVILDLMISVSLGLGAFFIVIFGCWALNSLNLYSTVLSVKATFPKLNTIWLTIILGAVGVIIALLDILESFQHFLWYLTVIFVPVAGVMIIDRLFIQPEAFNLETLENNRSLNGLAILAWAAGAIYAILAEAFIVKPLTHVGVLDAFIMSVVLYFVLAKVMGRKAVS